MTHTTRQNATHLPRGFRLRNRILGDHLSDTDGFPLGDRKSASMTSRGTPASQFKARNLVRCVAE